MERNNRKNEKGKKSTLDFKYLECTIVTDGGNESKIERKMQRANRAF